MVKRINEGISQSSDLVTIENKLQKALDNDLIPVDMANLSQAVIVNLGDGSYAVVADTDDGLMYLQSTTPWKNTTVSDFMSKVIDSWM